EKEFAGVSLSDTERKKELLFLQHEADEIEEAHLSPGEDEGLEEEYRRLSNSSKIMEALGICYASTGGDGSASEQVGRALRELSLVSEYDERIGQMERLLSDADALLSDFNRDISGYMDDAEFDGGRFDEVTKRLDLINGLKDKYGATIETVLAALEERKKKIAELVDFDEYLEDLKARRKKATDELAALCEEVSALRQAAAKELTAQVTEVLLELNFLDVRFDMAFLRTKGYSANGFDESEFMIALNPGEPLRPLVDVASGGELSRIMLAVKTVLAKGDAIDTLIFDEIDAGISGRAAQAVSEKLSVVAKEHQVICITHLPQIASMADTHFLIEKHIEADKTVSAIHPLSEEETVEELSRLLGGAQITEAVKENARELKRQANDYKYR
ncbi:MAG: DNA repair protein RecN, partial [Lachnospiraceae bacterium]|nr:DNA repair protein RecN [Lachnospiraceae bacterium]